MATKFQPPLLEKWANNIGVTKNLHGSWIESIAVKYKAAAKTGNRLLDIASVIGASKSNPDLYQSIAQKLGGNRIKTINGSWLATIVKLTTPKIK
jgi:hypothetical protein